MPDEIENTAALLRNTFAWKILSEFFVMFIQIAPYLVLSVFLHVAVLRFMARNKTVFTVKNKFFGLLSGALAGICSPIPTYAAIPMSLQLLALGTPVSFIISFIISSPLMNPSIFFLTVTQMGWQMTLARTLTALVMGVLAGFAAEKAGNLFRLNEVKVPGGYEMKKRKLTVELYRNALYTLKYFSLAILIASAAKTLIPADMVFRFFGSKPQVGILWAMLLGIPLYTCGGAAIPLLNTMMELGMSKGAALAFFVAGPATKAETLYAFNRFLGRRALAGYLLFTFVFAYASGLIFTFLFG